MHIQTTWDWHVKEEDAIAICLAYSNWLLKTTYQSPQFSKIPCTPIMQQDAIVVVSILKRLYSCCIFASTLCLLSPMFVVVLTSYSESNHWILSTSQLGSSGHYSGYSPVVPDGLGVSYAIREDDLHFSVSVFKSNPAITARDYANSLRETIHLVQMLCLRSNTPHKPAL